jgi:hypothetical protein
MEELNITKDNEQYEIDYAKAQCTKYYGEMKKAETIYVSIRDRWRKWKEQYEKLDRALAETDGRVQVIKRSGKPKPAASIDPVILTQEQIMEIANRLGIKIEVTGINDRG